MNSVLILYSGGKDSFLSTLRYLDKGYKVFLVNYNNSYEIGTKNISLGIKRLIKKYGEEKVVFLGTKSITPIFRNMIHPFYNYKFNDIVKKYGNISISQFNCLACRSSMYALSIILAKKYNIETIVDGARTCQLFAIEQEEMVKEFEKLFKKYKLKIEYPLKDYKDDWKLQNEILARGFIPKMNEAKCLLGCPISKTDIDKEIITGVVNVYNDYILMNVIKSIEEYSDIDISGDVI